jgi:hypothetical protein
LQFSDVSLYDFLQSIGLTPAKSKTIGELKVPDEFYADFLRGYFDGDGTVYAYWDKRWVNSLMYYCCYAGASMPLLEWLRVTNSRLAGVGKGSIRTGSRAFALGYAKSDSRLLFQYMYKIDGSPRLSRKYIKFYKFLTLDPYGIITPDARVL